MDRHSFSSSAAVFGGMNSKENDGSPASSNSRMAGACGGRLRDMITRVTVRLANPHYGAIASRDGAGRS